jgi:uncharacterized membrane protein YfcA
VAPATIPLADPTFLALAIGSVLLQGVSKGGFGGGLGILAVPLMSLAVTPIEAAAITAPLLCLMDLVGIRAYWGRWDKRLALIMLPGAALGMTAAALTYGAISLSGMRLLLGGIALAFGVHYWTIPLLGRLSPVMKPWMGPFAGALSGFTSFVAHAGGPPVQVFLLGLRLDKTLYVGTSVIFFMTINYAKIVPYWALGFFTRGTLITSAALAPLAVLGMWAGVKLHGRVPQQAFYRLCYAMLLVIGVKLTADGLGW